MNDIPEVTAKIIGYRQMSDGEMAKMNEGKALAVQCGEWVERLLQDDSLDQRWVNIGATHLQEGFMCVLRGIARPTTF